MGTRTTEVQGWKRLSLDFVAARPTYTGKLQGNQGDSTMQINSLRGLLTEYGEVMGVGRAALDKSVVGVLERLSGRLPAILIDTLREQWRGLDDLDRQIG